jgi:hypothetical protein
MYQFVAVFSRVSFRRWKCSELSSSDEIIFITLRNITDSRKDIRICLCIFHRVLGTFVILRLCFAALWDYLWITVKFLPAVARDWIHYGFFLNSLHQSTAWNLLEREQTVLEILFRFSATRRRLSPELMVKAPCLKTGLWKKLIWPEASTFWSSKRSIWRLRSSFQALKIAPSQSYDAFAMSGSHFS